MSVRRLLIGALVLCALAVADGCGSASHGASAATQSATPPPTGATVRTARCNLWRMLAPADRRRLVIGLRSFFGGRVDSPGARGQVVPDGRAYTLLTSYCSRPFASAFLLYRLYGDAAAFTAARPAGG